MSCLCKRIVDATDSIDLLAFISCTTVSSYSIASNDEELPPLSTAVESIIDVEVEVEVRHIVVAMSRPARRCLLFLHLERMIYHYEG